MSTTTLLRFVLAALLLACAFAAQHFWPTAQLRMPAPTPVPVTPAAWDAWLQRLRLDASGPAAALPPPVFSPPPSPVQPYAEVPRAREIAPRHWRIDDGLAQGATRHEP